MTALDEIVAYTRSLLAQRTVERPVSSLETAIESRPGPLDFPAALGGDGVALIAEVKKASPSRGLIKADFDHVAIAWAYARSGAAAVSVLTEPRFFLGSLEHLSDIAALPRRQRVPLLRKDFVLDPYQVYEARAYGADAVLLIASILDPVRLDMLLSLSRDLGMSCLVETHNEREVDAAVECGAEIVGINNRDLQTFCVDPATFERLRPRIPDGCLVVAESGVRTPADVRRLAASGADAVLVGEALITAGDIGQRTKEMACVT